MAGSPNGNSLSATVATHEVKAEREARWLLTVAGARLSCTRAHGDVERWNDDDLVPSEGLVPFVT